MMSKEFAQLQWDAELAAACRVVLEAAQAEDRQGAGDITTRAIIPANRQGQAVYRLRESGVVAGLPSLLVAGQVFDRELDIELLAEDGQIREPGTKLATVRGSAASILALERPSLNLLCRMTGIATRTRDWIEAANSDRCGIYDTRKTVPGLRRLEKYAVRCGGGRNHRTSLSEAILIKDNHLALAGDANGPLAPDEAVRRARKFIRENYPTGPQPIIEIEVDTWQQYVVALRESPDIILLDNMSADELRAMVDYRNTHAPDVELEASGGITLDTLTQIAATGIERISIGALTHSAAQLDIGLDWE